jgi:hypothetical protein
VPIEFKENFFVLCTSSPIASLNFSEADYPVIKTAKINCLCQGFPEHPKTKIASCQMGRFIVCKGWFLFRCFNITRSGESTRGIFLALPGFILRSHSKFHT